MSDVNTALTASAIEGVTSSVLDPVSNIVGYVYGVPQAQAAASQAASEAGVSIAASEATAKTEQAKYLAIGLGIIGAAVIGGVFFFRK